MPSWNMASRRLGTVQCVYKCLLVFIPHTYYSWGKMDAQYIFIE